MSVNKFKILQPRLTDKEINLPIEMTWDFLDRSNDIEVYEEKVIKDVINQDNSYGSMNKESSTLQMRTRFGGSLRGSRLISP
jgi:hypothetical protein